MVNLHKTQWGACIVLWCLTGCASVSPVHVAPRKVSLCHDANWVLSDLAGARALPSSNSQSCAADRLRLAAQLIENPGSASDLSRARNLVDSVENSDEITHEPALAGLAGLLDQMLADRRHADERIDKLTQQTRDQQLQIDTLSGKLQALTDLERSMALNASKKKVGP